MQGIPQKTLIRAKNHKKPVTKLTDNVVLSVAGEKSGAMTLFF
jgi:hypothetical protein